MSLTAIGFVPLIPTVLLAILAALALVATALGLWLRARGVLWRFALFALILLTLSGPVLTQEERDPLDDIALVVVDRSSSMALADRGAATEDALAQVRERVRALGHVELREVDLRERGEDGTRLEETVRAAVGEIDPERLSGVVVISDGQVHDTPEALERLGLPAPLHLLVNGRRDETDRRLVIEQVPSYGMVGEPQEMQIRVDDLPAAGGGPGSVPVVVRQNGQVIFQGDVRTGERRAVPFTLARAGESVIEVESAPLDGEITTHNNTALAFVQGVRDRLRVLLVSGSPYPGLRVWRNILKSDPAVDLVHFTILRPPEKLDGTPIQELALIAFPSRELFEVKLSEFDLIIFDRYSRRGLLPLAYLDNVARYVEQGGALLDAAGPEFAFPLSLYRTPLARVLPGRPSGRVFEQGFKPDLTRVGHRHPVTADLEPPDLPDDAEPPWGRWFRQIDIEADQGETLMSGVSDRPLLVLDRVGEGRVAQLLSDHAWLWASGFEGGGPQNQMLRRLVHWLMREPELEEEALTAQPAEDALVIRRRSLEDPREREVTLTSPSGASGPVTLRPHAQDDGVAEAVVPAGEAGVYQVTDGPLSAFAAVRPVSARERADVLATDAPLGPTVERTGGGAFWLGEDGTPELRPIAPGRTAAGRGWLGLEQNGRYVVTDTAQLPLFPPWLALTLLLGTLATAWWREGR
ncbi:hypothetical protein [Marinivivus vitaminiproducens]|uniref:hypothetical protein n=1 Tax=Marinivivus vitaminiproducens TaxID=3035935 RepID=UPI0027A3E860|nr:hypothetical protein P4R82_15055 [Geminicoccaceae bacterium SCSIO 64248]